MLYVHVYRCHRDCITSSSRRTSGITMMLLNLTLGNGLKILEACQMVLGHFLALSYAQIYGLKFRLKLRTAAELKIYAHLYFWQIPHATLALTNSPRWPTEESLNKFLGEIFHSSPPKSNSWLWPTEGAVFKSRSPRVTWLHPGSSTFWFCDCGQPNFFKLLFTYKMGI